MYTDQSEFDIRLEWGRQGVALLAPISDCVIIVDVLSFSTSVAIAVANGAVVLPYAGPLEGAASYAEEHGAELAQKGRSSGAFSLSPESMLDAPAGARLVLPSPNGSTLSLAAGATPVMTGCLRNARAVARAAEQFGRRLAVIPAGERWRNDGSLRPSFEDLVGAGALISHLQQADRLLSPEAAAAAAVFHALRGRLSDVLQQCSSGRELRERGFARDVALAAELDVSEVAAVLHDGAFIGRTVND